MIKLYLGGQFDHRHEVEQFNYILKIIEGYKNKLGNFCIIFGCSYISGEEVDCVIFKENAIIVIEMKNWKGKISGSENGDWKVDGKSFENVFLQCGRKRFAVMDKLNELFNYKKFDVSCWAVFNYGADCSDVKVHEKYSKSFRAISLDNLCEELIIERAKRTISNINMINKLIKDLNLQEKDFTDWMVKKPVLVIEENQHLIPRIVRDYEEYVIEKNFSQEYVIRFPVPINKDLLVICFVRNKSTGKEYLSIAPRITLKYWEFVEKYLLKVEHTWEKLEMKDIEIENNQIIRIGPLNSHKKDGIQIEILENEESLKRIWFNINSIEKIQEIILERSN